MDDYQQQFERKVGDSFITWYNESIGSFFIFCARPDDAPDLKYKDGDVVLMLEVTSSYYDNNDAKLLWQNFRQLPHAPKGWGGKNMDEALLLDVTRRIEKKCQNNYGKNCMLVVYIHPQMTEKEEVDELIHTVSVPASNPFKYIFLTGHFPMSTRSWGGYQCWKIA